jgi:ribonucleoside-diphosphate reductase beta chain
MAAAYIVYTQDKCSHCDRAKGYLRGLGIPFEERDLADPENKAVAKSFGWKTAPQILRVDGDYPIEIGGADELKEYLKI